MRRRTAAELTWEGACMADVGPDRRVCSCSQKRAAILCERFKPCLSASFQPGLHVPKPQHITLGTLEDGDSTATPPAAASYALDRPHAGHATPAGMAPPPVQSGAQRPAACDAAPQQSPAPQPSGPDRCQARRRARRPSAAEPARRAGACQPLPARCRSRWVHPGASPPAHAGVPAMRRQIARRDGAR